MGLEEKFKKMDYNQQELIQSKFSSKKRFTQAIRNLRLMKLEEMIIIENYFDTSVNDLLDHGAGTDHYTTEEIQYIKK